MSEGKNARVTGDVKDMENEADKGHKYNPAEHEERVPVTFNEYEDEVERLKNDLKGLKKIKKQQKKLEKLAEKKIELIRDIEAERERERRAKEKLDKKKRK